MATEYFPAPELGTLAMEIIEEHHSHLVEADIGYYYRSGTWTRKGNTVYGTAQKPSGLLKAVTGHDFIIVINGEVWPFLKPEKQTALLDHELQHCCRGEDDEYGNPTWYTQGHDFEDFIAIIRRHGLWTDELASIPVADQTYRQTTLPGLAVVK
jgi:hypothetical protein